MTESNGGELLGSCGAGGGKLVGRNWQIMGEMTLKREGLNTSTTMRYAVTGKERTRTR